MLNPVGKSFTISTRRDLLRARPCTDITQLPKRVRTTSFHSVICLVVELPQTSYSIANKACIAPRTTLEGYHPVSPAMHGLLRTSFCAISPGVPTMQELAGTRCGQHVAVKYGVDCPVVDPVWVSPPDQQGADFFAVNHLDISQSSQQGLDYPVFLPVHTSSST